VNIGNGGCTGRFKLSRFVVQTALSCQCLAKSTTNINWYTLLGYIQPAVLRSVDEQCRRWSLFKSGTQEI